MNIPLVSIIIPAYNAEKYIKEAIDLILGQTYKNLEVVVVNDGSTDKTEEIVKSYLSDTRFVYLKQENGGISKARNFGVKNSRGELIAFMDADDISAPDRIEKQVSFFEKNFDYGVVYSSFLSFYDNDEPFDPKNIQFYSYEREFPSGDIFKELLKCSFIKPSTVMIRKKVFDSGGGFDERFRDAEDWDLWRRLAYKKVLFGFIDKPLVYNRLLKESLSGFHNQVKMKKMNLFSFENLFLRMTPAELIDYNAEKILRKLKWKLAVACWLEGQKKEFRYWLKESGMWGRQFWRLISLLPVSLTSAIIKFFWKLKHRLLFRQIKNL